MTDSVLGDDAIARLRASLDRPDAGDRYEIGEQLGRGGMGTVFRAFDWELERDVALKVLSFDADTSALAERLAREARTLARLEHPGIVAVHDTGLLDDGRPFYVMRLVRGRRLADALTALGRGELLRAFLRVCEAVAYAHARGIIHRDLTPSNVMLGEYGETLVVDWGVARALDGSTEHRAIVGTPGFMAPEQSTSVSGAEIDARADVFALGAILDAIVRATRDETALSTPRALRAIVAHATNAARESRYPTVDALAADVRRWIDGEPVSAYRERPWEAAIRFYRRNEALVLLLAAYAVVRLLFLLWRRL